MKMSEIIFSVLFLSSFCLVSQEKISVTEATLSLAFDQTAEVFHSFAEGDKIVFNLSMVQGKHIKAVEIVELPNNIVFSSFKATTIKDKHIAVKNKGLYAFGFYSSSLTNRICSYRIDRIPESKITTNFNTNWKWVTVRDTISTPCQKDSLTGYKTVEYQETLRELKDKTLEEIMLFEKTKTVHSYYNENASRTYLKVDLPTVNNTFLGKKIYWLGLIG